MAQTTSGVDKAVNSRWIWPFELLEKIGEGGMGVVYRARYVGNNRIVAVKLLPQDVADNPSLAARFDRELEILKQLRHSNIVHCFGGQCESKQRFYAMELVEGGTLAELLHAKKRFSWDHVIDYGLQMCAALQHAHERGVVHRDVKPGNFLIAKSGQLKLSDFGLATMASASRITRAGKTAGTFLYMAPEQIRGQPPVSPKTDLYALGCVLHELLTGRPPFNAESPAEILRKHLKEPPPRLLTQVPDCPPALDQIIAELLAKNPDDRPESAAVIEARLKSILRPSMVHMDPFACTPSAPVDAVSESTADSEAEVPVQLPRSNPLWAPLTALLCVIAASGWLSYVAVWSRAAELEDSWMQIARSSNDAQRSAALEYLAESGTLSPRGIQRLAPLLEHPHPQTRVAVLKVLQRQAFASGSQLPAVLRMVQRDDSPDVRFQAMHTADAIRKAPTVVSAESWIGRLTAVGMAGVVVWWVWTSQVWVRWLRQAYAPATTGRISGRR